MKPLYLIAILFILAGCTEKNRKDDLQSEILLENNRLIKVHKNISINVNKIKDCKYPTTDPLFQKKDNKQLVLIQVTVKRLSGANKEEIIPFGAVLTDQKGNEYKNSPTVVAMAQNNSCISGNDLADYNAIWNGDITTNDTRTAFVIGFELPFDALPTKLYWNKDWLADEQFITLTP
jgi:hypothetical protein